MTKADGEKSGDKGKGGDRTARLAEALRTNLRRRKEAARSAPAERADDAASGSSPENET